MSLQLCLHSAPWGMGNIFVQISWGHFPGSGSQECGFSFMLVSGRSWGPILLFFSQVKAFVTQDIPL